jgi:Leucine-rich repeat (LRR) protein
LSLEIPFAPPLDLTRLPKLKECSLGCYSSGLESIFRLSQLERLYLDELRIEEFPAQSWLSLEVLRIKSSTIKRINLDCPRLTDLRLGGTNGFSNFTDLRLPMLRKLTCAECEDLEALDGLERCEQLQELELEDCGEIEGLEPLGGLTSLSTIRLLGNTTIRNGDLSMLKRLPGLKRIEIGHRPHYSHRILFGRLFP